MGLAGELTTIGLAEVFQNLSFKHLSGTLTVKQGEERALIWLDEGRIRAVKLLSHEFDYVDIARRAEVAPAETLDQAANGKRRRTLKAFLTAGGGLDEERYDAAVEAAVEDEILPLFGWSQGTFEFAADKVNERNFDREQLGCAISLDPLGVAMEAARRHDEWESIAPYAPAESDLLVTVDGWRDDPELGAPMLHLLSLCDGTRTVADLIKESTLRRFDVVKVIAQSVEAGALEPATTERLRDLAARARIAGKINLAADRLEVAISLDGGDLKARCELVRLYEQAGRKNDAAREQLAVAGEQEERGDLQGALESLERASVLAPKDLDILERIFKVHEARGEKAFYIKAGRRLVEGLASQGMQEDALPLYERLLRENEDNAPLRESYVSCLLQLDDKPAALTHLRRLADTAFEKQLFEQALTHCRRIVELDPECKVAAGRVRDIQSGRAAARAASKRRHFALACVGVVAGLALGQLVREWRAQTDLQEAARAATTALSRDNTDAARAVAMRRYAAACLDHPLTRGGRFARETLRTLIEAEIERVGQLLKKGEDARTTADYEYRIGRAREVLANMDQVFLPDDLQKLWDEARDRFREQLSG